ncbi:MAG: helix-turn-helix transcriptional regulator, partial [Sphingomonadaceae bacterium]
APAAHWTVDKLARVAGMSRTALAVRFHELIGEPPLQCLTRLRMDMATDMLLRDDAPVKSIAERVGYGTEAAFNRAFVRQLGTSPGRWRTDRRNALG